MMLIANKDLLIIKDYKEVKIMNFKKIIVTMDNYSYKVNGEDLRMIYYDRYEIRISGKIKVICYGL